MSLVDYTQLTYTQYNPVLEYNIYVHTKLGKIICQKRFNHYFTHTIHFLCINSRNYLNLYLLLVMYPRIFVLFENFNIQYSLLREAVSEIGFCNHLQFPCILRKCCHSARYLSFINRTQKHYSCGLTECMVR